MSEARSHRLAVRKAKHAELMDHFRWTPEQIARLTDRQIDEYAFHARSKDGAIARPEAPPSRAPRSEEEHLSYFRDVVARMRQTGLLRGGKRKGAASEEEMAARIRAMHEERKKKKGGDDAGAVTGGAAG